MPSSSGRCARGWRCAMCLLPRRAHPPVTVNFFLDVYCRSRGGSLWCSSSGPFLIACGTPSSFSLRDFAGILRMVCVFLVSHCCLLPFLVLSAFPFRVFIHPLPPSFIQPPLREIMTFFLLRDFFSSLPFELFFNGILLVSHSIQSSCMIPPLPSPCCYLLFVPLDFIVC